MKIILFTDTLGDLNGVSRFLQDMAELALEKEDDLQIVTSTFKYCPEAKNIHNFSPRFRVSMPFYNELDLAFPPSAQMEAFVVSNAPDIIHISTPGPVGIAGRKIAKKLKIPMIGTYHTDFPAYIRDNTHLEFLKILTDKWMKHFYSPFVHVFSRSEIYADIMQDEIGIDKDKISIIRPGTNLTRFSAKHADETILGEYGLKKESVKVLYVGRISKEKNVPFLLDMWDAFKKCNPNLNAQLIMVGEGNCKKRALQMRTKGVHYLGPIIGEKLSALYAISDIFVFPSLTDTLGQVVMESSASALPILVSTLGGPKSLLNPHAISGYSLENSIDKWVQHLQLLVEYKEHRIALGKSGETHMKSFSIENSYNDFIGIHKEYFRALKS